MWKRKRVWSWSLATQCLLFAGNPLRGANVCRTTRFWSWSLASQSASGWVEYSTTAWGGIRRRAPSPGQEQHQRLMERHNVCAVCHWPPAAGFIRSLQTVWERGTDDEAKDDGKREWIRKGRRLFVIKLVNRLNWAQGNRRGRTGLDWCCCCCC